MKLGHCNGKRGDREKNPKIPKFKYLHLYLFSSLFPPPPPPAPPPSLPSSPLPVDSILLVFVILLQFWWLFWQFEGCCLFTMVRPQSKRNARALLIDIARPCFVHFRDFEKWTLLKTQSPRQSWLVRFDLISCGRVMLDLPWCNPSAPGQCPFIPASAVSTVAFSNQIIHWFV